MRLVRMRMASGRLLRRCVEAHVLCRLVITVVNVVMIAAAITTAAAAAESLIVVDGNRRIDADAIRAHFHVHRGAAPDQFDLDNALKELYATGAFADVKIARS